MHPAIILFARSPEPGKVKTRLARAIGDGRATALYLAMVADTASAARKTGARLLWWIDGEVGGLAGIIGKDTVKRQPSGDLGARLAAAFRDAFSSGFGPVTAAGTDCPSLGGSHLAALLEKSGEFDAAFIPSPDGGYCAVGLKSYFPEVFREIPWSTSRTLEVSLKRIADAGKSCRLMDPLEDIDEFESLLGFYKSLQGKNRPDAPETGKVLASPEFAFLSSASPEKLIPCGDS
jgi:rSAM/selenodomain-associated transferase 1